MTDEMQPISEQDEQEHSQKWLQNHLITKIRQIIEQNASENDMELEEGDSHVLSIGASSLYTKIMNDVDNDNAESKPGVFFREDLKYGVVVGMVGDQCNLVVVPTEQIKAALEGENETDEQPSEE